MLASTMLPLTVVAAIAVASDSSFHRTSGMVGRPVPAVWCGHARRPGVAHATCCRQRASNEL
jgi:hypothetical protein